MAISDDEYNASMDNIHELERLGLVTIDRNKLTLSRDLGDIRQRIRDLHRKDGNDFTEAEFASFEKLLAREIGKLGPAIDTHRLAVAYLSIAIVAEFTHSGSSDTGSDEIFMADRAEVAEVDWIAEHLLEFTGLAGGFVAIRNRKAVARDGDAKALMLTLKKQYGDPARIMTYATIPFRLTGLHFSKFSIYVGGVKVWRRGVDY